MNLAQIRWNFISGAASLMMLSAILTVFNLPVQAQSPSSRDPHYIRPNHAYCLKLEGELARAYSRGTQEANAQQIRDQIQRTEHAYNRMANQAERRGCYSYFLFSKELRRTPRCVRLHRKIENAREQLVRLQNQLSQTANVGQEKIRRQDYLIRALAQNNCGDQYRREYNRRQSQANWFGEVFWGQPQVRDNYNDQGFSFSTYRTVCVRKCDGYFFPVSFATTTNRFPVDEQICQSKCAAPASLYYYPNPGGQTEQMRSVAGDNYNDLKNAWLYRNKYIKGCSCKKSEYDPEAISKALKDVSANSPPQQPQKPAKIATENMDK